MHPEEVYNVTVPGRAAISNLKIIGRKIVEREKGIVIATDGSCCTTIVIGNKDGITNEQWGKQLLELANKGKTIAYRIHSHPVYNLNSNYDPVKPGDKKPSEKDLKSQFHLGIL